MIVEYKRARMSSTSGIVTKVKVMVYNYSPFTQYKLSRMIS